MSVGPPFQTYREQLWSLYQGLPLWEPNPGGLYERVSIGDVGYVSGGAFIRMFNVRLPWDDESNRRFGIPDRYDPLAFDDLSIRRDTFDEVDHYSRFVSSVESANNFQATSPEQWVVVILNGLILIKMWQNRVFLPGSWSTSVSSSRRPPRRCCSNENIWEIHPG